MRIGRALITGGGGQLASDLEALVSSSAEVRSLPRAELDVTDDEAVVRALSEFEPDVVFNCAAFHNLDVCEREEERAFAVNAVAVKRLADETAARGAKLVHFSTNYVFDGTREDPYAEDDLPSPRSVYAISKLAGEYAALAYGDGALVVRSAGLYGLHGSASKGGNFIVRVLTRAREQGGVKMVTDQRLSPTFTADLAPAVVEAVEKDAAGIVHLTNSDACSWWEFTEAIFELTGVEATMEPLQTARQRGAADRPLNGVLARPRADAAGLTPLRDWRDALADYLDRAGFASAAAESGSPVST